MKTYKSFSPGLIVGIDATNLRRGGGVTHLIELISATHPNSYGISEVLIWSSKDSLRKLPHQPWLKKITNPSLNAGLLQRAWWQKNHLSITARAAGCKVLFVPGGSYAGSYRPVVTMSQNLLPFECHELRRYGCSTLALKYLLLRYTQTQSFRKAEGIIFLTEYAKRAVLGVTGGVTGKISIIPHGINSRFQIKPKPQRPIASYSQERPFRILYVSIINHYKHQWHLVEALHILRKENFPLALDLVGPFYPPAFKRFRSSISKYDPHRDWVHYHGPIPYDRLHEMYGTADLGAFASSCENMPNILLETMAAGLPIVCSNRGPMSEVLGDAGLYFNPESPPEIADKIRTFLLSPKLRGMKANASFARAKQYSWRRCADETFSFLAEIARNYSQSNLST